MVELAWQAMMGVGLAASAGLRAFLPLLVIGLAGRVGLLELSSPLAWLSSDRALWVLAVAVVVELAGDKVPAVDHLLDAVGTIARPIAGTLAAAAPLARLDPVTALVVGLILGGTVAGGVHAAKAGVRIVSSGTTGGLANPLLSAAEDGVTLAASVTSLFVPVVTFVLALACLYLLGRSRRDRPGPPPARAASS